MANLKLGGIATEISGKIGGQSLANMGNYATIKNITQRNTIPTAKQARQRFITGQLSNSWGQLTQTQRDGWETTSVNYTWYNNVHVQITRNGFSTYSFLNQNLILLGIGPNSNAPAYVPVAIPKINIIDISSGFFTIQSNNSSATYLYALFGAPNLPKGVSYAKNRMKFCGYITSAQLLAGYDVIASLEAVFGTLTFPNKISIIIDPINQTTGNRNQFVTEIQNIDRPMIVQFTVLNGNSVTIPFVAGGTYLGSIYWGDGVTTTFTAWNSAGATHVYTQDGVFTASIYGTFPKFSVNTGNPKAYLSNILQFGSNAFTKLNFYDCKLLTVVTPSDTPYLTTSADLSALLRSCTNLITFKYLELWETSLVVNMGNLMSFMNFNLDITTWNLVKVTTLASAFRSNATFNQNVQLWNVSVCTNFFEFKRAPSGLIQSFAAWDIRAAINMTNFSGAADIGTQNWTDTLIAWNALVNPPAGITITVVSNYFIASGAPAARANLIAAWGWTINDSGGI